jgi:hypothetical protein
MNGTPVFPIGTIILSFLEDLRAEDYFMFAMLFE